MVNYSREIDDSLWAFQNGTLLWIKWQMKNKSLIFPLVNNLSRIQGEIIMEPVNAQSILIQLTPSHHCSPDQIKKLEWAFI